MKRYFLGLAANYSRKQRLAHTFAVGRKKDCAELREFLEKKYGGEAVLTKNGRSALALALKACFQPGEAVLVNGFTCYAVYEAVKEAKLVPIWVDISKDDLNFDIVKLKESDVFHPGPRPSGPSPRAAGANSRAAALRNAPNETSSDSLIRGIIIQNTLGNPVDIVAIEKFAKRHDLTIIEDLAHCTGVKYSDGREAGTVGAAVALSFGKDKSIDAISGGAVVLRGELSLNLGPRPAGPSGETELPRSDNRTSSVVSRLVVPSPRAAGARPRAAALRIPSIQAKASPCKPPRPSDHLRARFYPMFGALCRTLSYVHLGGVLMRFLVKIHWVERSADNKLDLDRRISKFQAKMALRQLKSLKRSGEPPLREFYLVEDREKVLGELKKAGYYFDGLWYEKPVSPKRYYKKVHFPEEKCPNAVFVSEHIINFPTYYSKKDLARARKIVEENQIKEQK